MTKITHEAEIQRQHPRYRLPVRCIHNGAQVYVIDISVGGLGVKSGNQEVRVGNVLDLTLVFPFSGYELTLPVRAEVRYVDEEHSRIGLRYVDVSPRQHNLLRFILDAYLAGEIIEAGDILDVVSRRNEGKTREVPQRPQTQGFFASMVHHKRTFASYVGIAAATLFLLGFIGLSVFERLYIIPAQTALITADLVNVLAPANGQLTFLASTEEVRAGEPLLTIQGPQGNSIVIDSPCHCVVQSRYNRVSNFVREGAPLLTLREKTSVPYITASIPYDQALRFYRGASAIIEYSDGTRVRESRIERLPMLVDKLSSESQIYVKLAPGRVLDASTIGQPVSVIFNTFSSSAMGSTASKLQAVIDWAGRQAADAFRAESEILAAPRRERKLETSDERHLARLEHRH